jgi:hypothetical protein
MARRKSRTQTKVVVRQASTVELTKKRSQNSLEVTVHRGEMMLGTLVMGQGSVEWWPKDARVRAMRKTWTQFADLLDRESKK